MAKRDGLKECKVWGMGNGSATELVELLSMFQYVKVQWEANNMHLESWCARLCDLASEHQPLQEYLEISHHLFTCS